MDHSVYFFLISQQFFLLNVYLEVNKDNRFRIYKMNSLQFLNNL